MKITDYLAVYAALLSTLVFLWNVMKSRPRVQVDLIYGIETVEKEVQSGVYVYVRNLSSYEVHLSGIDILYPYKEVNLRQMLSHMWEFKRWPRHLGWVYSGLSNFQIECGCPLTLEARKSHSVFIPQTTLAELQAKSTESRLIACVHDQLWNRVYSKGFTYTPRTKIATYR